jgi:hypothetical protein
MDGQNFDNGNYQDNTANIPYQAPVENAGPQKANGMQIASLVLGIIGIPACCCYGIVGILFGLIGLILAIVGNKKNKGAGVGVAGLVCSIIAIVFGVIALIYYAYVIQQMMADPSLYYEIFQQLGIE